VREFERRVDDKAEEPAAEPANSDPDTEEHDIGYATVDRGEDL